MWKFAFFAASFVLASSTAVRADDAQQARANMQVVVDAVYNALGKKPPKPRELGRFCHDESCSLFESGFLITASARLVEIIPNRMTDPDQVIDACASALSTFSQMNKKRALAFMDGAFHEAGAQPFPTSKINGITIRVMEAFSTDPSLKCQLSGVRAKLISPEALAPTPVPEIAGEDNRLIIDGKDTGLKLCPDPDGIADGIVCE